MKDSPLDIIIAVICLILILGVFIAPIGYLNRWFTRRTVIDFDGRKRHTLHIEDK
jgi:hypothetical protein